MRDYPTPSSTSTIMFLFLYFIFDLFSCSYLSFFLLYSLWFFFFCFICCVTIRCWLVLSLFLLLWVVFFVTINGTDIIFHIKRVLICQSLCLALMVMQRLVMGLLGKWRLVVVFCFLFLFFFFSNGFLFLFFKIMSSYTTLIQWLCCGIVLCCCSSFTLVWSDCGFIL